MNIINIDNGEVIAEWPNSPWEIKYGDRISIHGAGWVIVGQLPNGSPLVQQT